MGTKWLARAFTQLLLCTGLFLGVAARRHRAAGVDS